MIVTTTYRYCRERSMVGDFGRVWFDDVRSVLLTAECEDVGETAEFPSGVALVWTAETDARIAEAELTGDELIGCVERVEDEFWWVKQSDERAA